MILPCSCRLSYDRIIGDRNHTAADRGNIAANQGSFLSAGAIFGAEITFKALKRLSPPSPELVHALNSPVVARFAGRSPSRQENRRRLGREPTRRVCPHHTVARGIPGAFRCQRPRQRPAAWNHNRQPLVLTDGFVPCILVAWGCAFRGEESR